MNNDVQFFQVRMGRQFYEVTVPTLTAEIRRLNDLLALGIEMLKKQPAAPAPAAQRPQDRQEG